MLSRLSHWLGDWQGVFKLRIGDYRVLYAFDTANNVITVF